MSTVAVVPGDYPSYAASDDEVFRSGTPEWWLNKLNLQLIARQPLMEKMDAYYYGDHPLPFLTRAHDAKMRNEFKTLLEDSRSNFMRLVVDVVEERLRVEGFRLSATNDTVADTKTWDIWQANCMDAESQTAFVESLVKGVSYLSVWKTPGDKYPTIAVEDPLQTIIGYQPGTNHKVRAAALKTWRDDWTGKDRADVYLPDGIYKFEAASTRLSLREPDPSNSVVRTFGWKPLENEPAFVKNPLNVVPIIPLRNRPRLLLEGESEISDVVRVQNQINGFLFLLALAGYFGAHKQRWAVGLTIMTDDKGNPVEPYNIATDRLLTESNPNARFGEFQQTDLTGYQGAIDQKVRHIATTTRTPRHYLEQTGQSPSGDAIQSAESGLVKKVERKQRPFGEGLEEALRLARLFNGETDVPVDSEIVWADARVRTDAEITDAAIKKFQAGLTPWEQTMEDLGYSQTQIARMKTMGTSVVIEPGRAVELAIAAAGTEPVTPTEPEPVSGQSASQSAAP